MSQELKPCPFCGSEFTQVRYMGGKWQEPSAFSSGYRGECCDCGVTTAAFYTEAEAAVAWNTRAERTTIVGEVAWPGDSATLYVCKKCGGWTYAEDEPNFCSMCGAKVERIEREGTR